MNFPKATLERFKHIEFLLQFRGWVNRSDLIDYFEIGEAAATRDFRHYKDLCPENMALNKSSKKWELQAETFIPRFPLTSSTVFAKLRNPQLSEAVGLGIGDYALSPPRLSFPDTETLAVITRAIALKSAVRIVYVAASRVSEFAEIVPHSLVDNGLRWHVRSYDRTNNRYWDFVLGRVSSAELINGKLQLHETIENDTQWNRQVRLELIPHPNKENLPNAEALMLEYGMEEGLLIHTVRAAVAGYWLRLWNVDCSKDSSLKGKHYQLSLNNPQTLYDVSNALMAPGYLS
ncbi:WYL domain-containing protein [Neptunomonas japonica]|uniref:WYL domain-containing protein n=1 Tax=Neptunomonas japonica TaxID=417574 RepID=UPI0004067F7C|nr:WYL domain-containing protein [Neptunomonas japonica]